MAVDPEDFKAVMGQWPSGVTVVTTADSDGPAGMTASSFSSVSLEPPLVSICVAKHLYMHQRIQETGVFAINILSKDKVEDGLRFAGMLPDVEDRFAGVQTFTAQTGAPLLPGMLGWVDCRLWQRVEAGDHSIFIGEVQAAGIEPGAAPLLYHSRAWGQFADVLAGEVRLSDAGTEQDALIVDQAFGTDTTQAPDAEAVVARVRAALAQRPDAPLLVLDDAAAAGDPLSLRLVLQGLAGQLGRTAVALRPGAGPMALANVLVALKSGVHALSVNPGSGGPWVARADVEQMLSRMDVAIRS